MFRGKFQPMRPLQILSRYNRKVIRFSYIIFNIALVSCSHICSLKNVIHSCCRFYDGAKYEPIEDEIRSIFFFYIWLLLLRHKQYFLLELLYIKIIFKKLFSLLFPFVWEILWSKYRKMLSLKFLGEMNQSDIEDEFLLPSNNKS